MEEVAIIGFDLANLASQLHSAPVDGRIHFLKRYRVCRCRHYERAFALHGRDESPCNRSSLGSDGAGSPTLTCLRFRPERRYGVRDDETLVLQA